MLRILLPAVAGYLAYHCMHTSQGRSATSKIAKRVLKEAGATEETITKLVKVAKTASETFNAEETENEKKDGSL